MAPILEVKNLTKTYGRLVAVNDVSFAIRAGICFGLLGPNGAGKTTTLEVIENILTPSSGDILYKGQPRTTKFKNEVGIQFQDTSLLAMLTVWETLQVFKALYQDTEDLNSLVERCQLQEFKHQRHENLSGGQRQRFLLALALVNRPHLLFLDEPSTGLDPQARRNLWHIVNAIKASGKTIILTTHYMEEAQHLCDEVAIMDHGRIIARDAPETLIRTHCQGVTVVLPRSSFRQPPRPAAQRAGDKRCRAHSNVQYRRLSQTTPVRPGRFVRHVGALTESRARFSQPDRSTLTGLRHAHQTDLDHVQGPQLGVLPGPGLFRVEFSVSLSAGGRFRRSFRGPAHTEYKIGVFPAPADTMDVASLELPEAFKETRFLQFVGFASHPEAMEKLRHHKVDLVIQAGPPPHQYWINESSPKGYLAEKIFQASLTGEPIRPCSERRRSTAPKYAISIGCFREFWP